LHSDIFEKGKPRKALMFGIFFTGEGLQFSNRHAAIATILERVYVLHYHFYYRGRADDVLVPCLISLIHSGVLLLRELYTLGL